jgi:hypothetical protein
MSSLSIIRDLFFSLDGLEKSQKHSTTPYMITINQSTGAVLNPAQVEITENSAQLQTEM